MQPPADIPVPSPRARWSTIWHFALSVNGYETYVGDLAELEGRVRAQWDRSGSLPQDVETLRYTLFFLQRRFRWNEESPEGADAAYVRAIVAQIAEVSGGTVEGLLEFEEAQRREELRESSEIDVDDASRGFQVD